MTTERLPPVTELLAGYATGSISPVEATRAALAAIEAHDDTVNAFVLVDADGALTAAEEATKRWRREDQLGPTDGVPTAIKDIFLTRDWPTLRGSSLIDPAGPWPEDAPAVARLREGGAVFVGKTTTPEFAWKGVTDSPTFGATGNAWCRTDAGDADLTAGGSSGGSATAVATGMCAWALGTDGGGSVRIPASFTGTVALKATYGLVPHYPASPFGTLAHAGPMTRTVADTALMMDLLTRPDDRDWSAMPTPTGSFATGLDEASLSGLRIGYSPDLGFTADSPFPGNDPEVAAAVRVAVEMLAEAGAVVEEVDPGFADPVDAFHVLWFSGAAKVLAGHTEEELARVDPGLLARVRAAADLTARDYLEAMAVRMELGQRMGRFHRDHDVLITPTMPIPAFGKGLDVPDGWPGEVWTSWSPYTYPFNMTQQPALSVPCGFTAAGLPIGLQVVGPRHGDATVLRVGRAYEKLTDWGGRTPSLLDNGNRS